MEFIGFSQTRQWYFEGAFLSQMPSGGTQLRWEGGGSIGNWADPAYVGWTTSALNGAWCTTGSGNPDRIVMNISGPTSTDVNQWHNDTLAAVQNARRLYPGIRTVYLQPVVGGPGHTTCTFNGVTVRASFNEPYISQAISRLVSEGVGVWGANPLVHSCADYADDIGHLTPTGYGNAAVDVGAFYHGR